MKKISILMVVCIILSLTAVYAASSFSDVVNTKYNDAVEKLVELGVINGFEDNTFKPKNDVTRAQFAKMVVEASKLKASSDLPLSNFSDISNNHWAYNYIKVAVDNDIINGYEDGTFRPDKNVSYAESMAMILRAMKLEEKMTDKSWPTGYINEAKKVGLLNQVDYTEPNTPANRGETAVSLYNMINIIEKTTESAKESTIPETPQNNSTKWAGKYFNNIDGYIELTIEEIGDNKIDFYFKGYKYGSVKAGSNTAIIKNDIATYEETFFDNVVGFDFTHEGNNIKVTSKNSSYSVFNGTYKVDDGTINKIELSDPNAINATYSNNNVDIELQDCGNGTMSFELSGSIGDRFLFIGLNLDYSNGVASKEEESFGDLEKIRIIVSQDQIVVEASSTDSESYLNLISGTYKLKNKNTKTIEEYKEKMDGVDIAHGAFLY